MFCRRDREAGPGPNSKITILILNLPFLNMNDNHVNECGAYIIGSVTSFVFQSRLKASKPFRYFFV